MSDYMAQLGLLSHLSLAHPFVRWLRESERQNFSLQLAKTTNMTFASSSSSSSSPSPQQLLVLYFPTAENSNWINKFNTTGTTTKIVQSQHNLQQVNERSERASEPCDRRVRRSVRNCYTWLHPLLN